MSSRSRATAGAISSCAGKARQPDQWSPWATAPCGAARGGAGAHLGQGDRKVFGCDRARGSANACDVGGQQTTARQGRTDRSTTPPRHGPRPEGLSPLARAGAREPAASDFRGSCGSRPDPRSRRSGACRIRRGGTAERLPRRHAEAARPIASDELRRAGRCGSEATARPASRQETLGRADESHRSPRASRLAIQPVRLRLSIALPEASRLRGRHPRTRRLPWSARTDAGHPVRVTPGLRSGRGARWCPAFRARGAGRRGHPRRSPRRGSAPGR